MSRSHKFCINCIYYSHDEGEEYCHHPKSEYMQDMNQFLVSGLQDDLPNLRYTHCTAMRKFKCGEQGRYWVSATLWGAQTALLPGPDPVPVKHLQTTWDRVWPWIQPAAVIAALWLIWWVAVQLTD